MALSTDLIILGQAVSSDTTASYAMGKDNTFFRLWHSCLALYREDRNSPRWNYTQQKIKPAPVSWRTGRAEASFACR